MDRSTDKMNAPVPHRHVRPADMPAVHLANMGQRTIGGMDRGETKRGIEFLRGRSGVDVDQGRGQVTFSERESSGMVSAYHRSGDDSHPRLVA